MIPAADLARNKWRSILPALGVGKEFLTGKHGPCPMCGGDDRFRFDDKDGKGTYFCNGCGAGDGFKLLMGVNGWAFRDAADAIRPIVGDLPASAPRSGISDDAAAAACRKLWRSGGAIDEADEAGRYLSARGFHGPYPRDLRFVADCAVTGVPGRTTMAAMIAVVRDPTGDGASIHRTYVEAGGKAAIDSPRRMMPGQITKGSAIRLSGYVDVLGIAEGIENAMAVMRDHGVPCWAASTAGLLADFIWPDDIRKLIVFGDNDRKFGGQAAAYRLAHRAATARNAIDVEVRLPDEQGVDWWDVGERRRLAA